MKGQPDTILSSLLKCNVSNYLPVMSFFFEFSSEWILFLNILVQKAFGNLHPITSDALFTSSVHKFNFPE